MKKLRLLFSLVVLTAFVACNGDDPVPGLELDGDVVVDFEGFYDDYGTRYLGPPLRDEATIEDTHRSYAVMLTDGEFIDDCWPSGKSYYFWLDLYSPNVEEGSFVNGEYDFSIDFPQGDRTDLKLGDFFGSADQTETYYDAAEGTVTISGTFPNITAKVDLDVYYYSQQGLRGEGTPDAFHTLTGTFKGTLVEQSLCD